MDIAVRGHVKEQHFEARSQQQHAGPFYLCEQREKKTGKHKLRRIEPKENIINLHLRSINVPDRPGEWPSQINGAPQLIPIRR